VACQVYAGKDPLTGREICFRKTRRTEVEAQIRAGQAARARASRAAARLGSHRRRAARRVPPGRRLGRFHGRDQPRLHPPHHQPALGAKEVLHVAFNYVVKGGRKVRKDTKTHQERHLAIDPVTCTLVREHLAAAEAAPVRRGPGRRRALYRT
jgi:hypothetical protein